MKDPYTILNISHGASSEEIRQAYRTLAKKYHPDRYSDPVLAEKASEKMKEINEAYHILIKQPQESTATAKKDDYTEIDELIRSDACDKAEKLLDVVPSTERNARWYYLMAELSYRKGWLEEAYNYAETACRLERGNQEYLTFYDKMSAERRTSYGDLRSSRGSAGGCFFCGSEII